jgi:protein tyrosine phosphatase
MKYFNQKVKFEEAEQICESYNATLISIHSAEENEFIRSYVLKQSLYSTNVWIGLKRNISGSHEFVWVDKSPLDYVNWSINKPDVNQVKTFIGVQVHKNGEWSDFSDGNFVFLCGINCK